MRTLSGRFAAGGSSARRFTISLDLDGALSIALRGPKGTQYDLALQASGGEHASTSAPGSARDGWRFEAACRTTAQEQVRREPSAAGGLQRKVIVRALGGAQRDAERAVEVEVDREVPRRAAAGGGAAASAPASASTASASGARRRTPRRAV